MNLSCAPAHSGLWNAVPSLPAEVATPMSPIFTLKVVGSNTHLTADGHSHYDPPP
jgi:hypothetical protein